MKIWFGSTVPLSINYSASLCSVSLLLSHHLMLLIVGLVSCWILLFFFFFLLHLLSPPTSPFTCQVRCVTPRKIGWKRKRGGTTSRQIEAERARGDGTQRNMRLLSKNTSLSVSQPSILICMRKSARSQMQERAWHARVYTQTYTLQGQPACVFASTHFHSRWRTLWWQGQR